MSFDANNAVDGNLATCMRTPSIGTREPDRKSWGIYKCWVNKQNVNGTHLGTEYRGTLYLIPFSKSYWYTVIAVMGT